jgi:dihydropteroate synthase
MGGRVDGGRDFGPPAARPSGAMSRSGLCELWGVLNVTPDSFSDGGLFLSPAHAVARAKTMLAEGADVIDVGGASSRPRGRTYGEGAAPVSADEEIARVVPVVEVLARELGARVSIDTAKPEVARAALVAGARIVNDVSMGASDALLEAVAQHDAELVLMHSRGDGSLSAEHTRYDDVVVDVARELSEACARAAVRGVRETRLWIDPGIGFAKTASQSATLLAALPQLACLGPRVLVGASRKSFIAALAPERDGSTPPADARLAGSVAALTVAVLGGASAVRVHDVRESFQALLLTRAILEAGGARG